MRSWAKDEFSTYDFTPEMADEAVSIATEVYELVESKIRAREAKGLIGPP